MHFGTTNSTLADLLNTIIITHKPDAAFNAAGKVLASALNGVSDVAGLVQALKKQRRDVVLKYLKNYAESLYRTYTLDQLVCSDVFGLVTGASATIVNGKVFVHSDTLKPFFFTRLQFPQTALALRGTTQRQIFVKSVPVVQDFGLTQLVFIIVQFIYALFQQELLGRSRVWVIQMDQIRFIRRKGSWPSN